jgi:hypothetical protein
VAIDRTKTLQGHVYNTAGGGLAGARVIVTPVGSKESAPRGIQSRIAKRSNGYETYTDASGAFSIDVTDFEASACHVTASLEGFEATGADVKLDKRISKVELTLRRRGQNDYQYYDESAEQYLYGDGESASLMSSIRIPASDLPATGGKVISVSFMPLWLASAYYVIIDAGDKRLVTHKIPSVTADQQGQMITIDLSDVSTTFPPGKDLYVGYAIKNAQVTDPRYNGFLFVCAPGGDNIYLAEFDMEHSTWFEDDEGYSLVLKTSIVATPADEVPASFADIGISSIADPGNGHYANGDNFQLEVLVPKDATPLSIAWYYDSKDISGSKSISLKSGQHVLNAMLKYIDGSEETLELRLDVK